MSSLTTRLLHGDPDQRNNAPHRELKTPVYDSVAFEFDTAEEMHLAFTAQIQRFSYSRSNNPTIAALEKRLAYGSGAADCIVTSSGMSAITVALAAVCGPGENIVSSPLLFAHTHALMSKTLADFGVETRFVVPDDLAEVERLIDANTRVLFLETIANPQMRLFDIDGLARLCRERNVLLMLDNTLPTPALFDAAAHGVDRPLSAARS